MKKHYWICMLLGLLVWPNVLSAQDIGVSEIRNKAYQTQDNIYLDLEITNYGASTITSFDVYYDVDGGQSYWENVTGVSIPPAGTYEHVHAVTWFPSATDSSFTIAAWTYYPNATQDLNISNDTAYKVIEVGAPIPNIIDQYLMVSPVMNVISNSGNNLDNPRDLDFHTNLNRKELWVVNKRTENQGSSVRIYFDAGEAGQWSTTRVDGNAWHFMSLTTGIAFSDNENFATSPGVFDANHDGGTPFTGPALWSSDLTIFAQPSGGNGSHLDMLHSSPYSQGIAAEKDNVFWVVDGYSGDIVRYDFVDDHGPGNSFHGDAIIRRYNDFNITKDPGDHIVSHCELDADRKWLYVVDHGGQRVLRLDITTGSQGGVPSFGPFETVAEYRYITGYTWEVVANTGMVEPAGIDVIEDRMIVSDHSNGDIIVFDISSIPAVELGRISTGSSGIMGLTIGPEGRIWYVNATNNEVVRVDGNGLGIQNTTKPKFSLFPNPTEGTFQLEWSSDQDLVGIVILNELGQEVLNTGISETGISSLTIETRLPNGLYFVQLHTRTGTLGTQRMVINR